MTTALIPMAPDRTAEQKMAALELANHTRIYRANLKRGLRGLPPGIAISGVKAIVADPPPAELATMKVADLLRAIPRWGRTKVNKVLLATQASHAKTLAGLTPRQRQVLVEILDCEARRR